MGAVALNGFVSYMRGTCVHRMWFEPEIETYGALAVMMWGVVNNSKTR